LSLFVAAKPRYKTKMELSRLPMPVLTYHKIGTPKEGEPPVNTLPDTVSGYLVYRSLDQRPRRTLLAEARPPNNCYDVLVDIQPRSTGTLSRRGRQWIVVPPADPGHEWVVTRIRAVSRSLAGPYSAGPAC